MTKGLSFQPYTRLKPLSFNKNPYSRNKYAFTLVELILVIIIVGILASLGLTQYDLMVEKSRTAEAKVRIGVMRNLAYSYYLEHGSLENMQNADVGVDGTCSSTDFYAFMITNNVGTGADLGATRCLSGGKSPNTEREYYYYLKFYPISGQSDWHCYYTGDGSSCFGMSTGTGGCS